MNAQNSEGGGGFVPAPNQILVTCHMNADFDALAAMFAAARLLGACDLLFPGSQEKNVAKVWEDLKGSSDLPIGIVPVAQEEAKWESYGKLVVVDTSQRSRLAHVAPLLSKEGVETEVWDHHPQTSDSIGAQKLHIAQTGAVTSLLVERIQDRGLAVSAKEATLFGLGIYSDTGSFSYSSTTPEDFRAAAWLLEQGMDINDVNDMAAFEMTRTHVHALNGLLESAKSYSIAGVEVVLAETSLDQYMGDFAYLAHHLMEMEKFSVLFAIGRMDDRVQVVARSRSNAINVGQVCLAFGGGGHAYAASASVRGKSMSEVHDGILEALYMQQSAAKTAREYMSSPCVGMEEGHSMKDADELMMHFSLKSLPIFFKGTKRCCGILDGAITQRAVAHGLSGEPVEHYMTRRIHTLPLDASLQELASIIVGMHQRLVPLLDENGEVEGVVTRTDLIGIFAEESGRMEAPARQQKGKSLSKSLHERLPKELVTLLDTVVALARELKAPVYLVGGFVRDFVLRTPNHDIDLVVEGNGLAFAAKLAKRLGGRARVHKKFLTSAVIYPDAKGVEQRVDVATARLEYYESPAAMPTVELSSIKMDLYRRDFTINSLAIRLDSTPGCELIDFFGGQRDIKEKAIRVLHTLSFVEDPTRCMRAVRFEQRYGFRIGPGTEKLIRNAVAQKMLEKLSPARIFNEFEHICAEETAAAALSRLDELGILASICPTLRLNPDKADLLARVGKVCEWYRLLYLEEEEHPWIVYFLVLVRSSNYADALEAFSRLGVPQMLKQTVLGGRERMRALRGQLKKVTQDGMSVSAFCQMLSPVPVECLLYLMAEAKETAKASKALSRYITSWRFAKASVTGDDLRRLGLTPGPSYRTVLKKVLEAVLDKGLSPEEQLELAQGLVEDIKKGQS